MKKFFSLFMFLFTIFALPVFSGEFSNLYGTWGFTNTAGKLITLNIQEKSVELNSYQVDNGGIIDFDNFPAWMLDHLQSEAVAISKDSALFTHESEKSRGLLKFQPFDSTWTQDFYLYLDSPRQLLLKAVEFSESPTLYKIFAILRDSSDRKPHIEATFYKIR